MYQNDSTLGSLMSIAWHHLRRYHLECMVMMGELQKVGTDFKFVFKCVCF